MKLVPQHGLRVILHVIGTLVDRDVDDVLLQMGHHPLAPDVWPRLQLNTSDDAVPVALRLVGNAVRVLSHADVLDAVVDADGNFVGVAKQQVVGNVIAMGRRQRHASAHLMTVDVDLCLNMRTLQIERYRQTAPITGHIDLATIPRRAHIVAFRGEEEGELHLSLHAVFLHIGIEVEA